MGKDKEPVLVDSSKLQLEVDKLTEQLKRANRIIDELNDELSYYKALCGDLSYYKELVGKDKEELQKRVEELESIIKEHEVNIEQLEEDKEFYQKQYMEELTSKIRYKNSFDLVMDSLIKASKEGGK